MIKEIGVGSRRSVADLLFGSSLIMATEEHRSTWRGFESMLGRGGLVYLRCCDWRAELEAGRTTIWN